MTELADTSQISESPFDKFLNGITEKIRSLFGQDNAVEKGRNPGQFSTWLPYRAWDKDRELFILSHGVGFCLEVVPQSGADQSMIDILRGLYLNWPTGSSVQISLFGTPHIQPLLKNYVNQRKQDDGIDAESKELGRPARSHNIFRKLARRRYEHWLRGTSESLVTGGNYMLRDFRLLISVSMPGKHDDMLLRDELMRRRASVESTLQSAHYPTVRWDPADLINWCADFCNPYRLFAEPDPLTYDYSRQLRDQIVDFDTKQTNQEGGILFTKSSRRSPVEARFYAVKSYPQYFQLWRMAALVGDALQTSLQYPCPFVLTMGASFLDPGMVSSTTTANQMRATQNAESKMAPFMGDVKEKQQDWNEALNVLTSGGNHVHLYHSLALFAHPDEIDQAETTAESLWRDQGFSINNVSFMHRNVFLASLPMGLSPKIAKKMYDDRLMSTKSIDNAVALSPMISEWRGSKTPVMCFAGRRGQVTGLDLYDNPEGNYNLAIVGTPGSGKSFLLNEIASSYLGIGATVWMLDLGKSFERLCHKAGGQWIELFSGCGICVNPFTHIVDITDDIAMLQAIVSKMAAPTGGLDPVQHQAIATAIMRCWEDKNKDMTVTDIREIFLTGKLNPDDEKDRRITDLAIMLEPYCEGGAYAEFFHGKSNIDFKSNLIVIEVEGLKRSPALHRVVMMILLFRITGEMYFSRDRKKLLIIDELKQQLGGDDDTVVVQVIEEAARRARKYGGSLVTATHTVDDYHETKALLTAFVLSDAVFILRQRKESLELLGKSGKLSMDEFTKRLMQSMRMVKGSYAEMYAYTQMGQGVLRLIPDPYSLLLFSNRFEDNGPLDEKMARGLSVDESIEELLKERGGKAA